MKDWFNQFRSALLFITILPAGTSVAHSPMGMIKFFPLVGLVIGCLLALVDQVASFFWPPAAVAVLDVCFLTLVTGAFHLDGLGDTADGIFSHQSKERALEIMKDSRTGMMGLVAVFCILALKTAGIFSLKTAGMGYQAPILMLIIPAYSRGAMIFGIRFFRYGRLEKGTGKDLFERPVSVSAFAFFLIPVVISFFLGYKGLVLNVMFVLVLSVMLAFYKKKIGSITGDMLGALNEVMEAMLFMAAGAVLI